MTKEQVKEYQRFMENPENEMNCSECPENREFSARQGRKACGQQNCWVKLHCER